MATPAVELTAGHRPASGRRAWSPKARLGYRCESGSPLRQGLSGPPVPASAASKLGAGYQPAGPECAAASVPMGRGLGGRLVTATELGAS